MAIRILITGSRDWTDKQAIYDFLCEHGPGVIVHGACPKGGADLIAHQFATAWGWSVEPWRAKWDKYGKGAGPRRNQAMVDSGAELCGAFRIGLTGGTADCVRRVKAAGIPLVEVWGWWPPSTDADAWRELYEERAAIMEYDAGMPRQQAEQAAREEMAQRFRIVRARENVDA